SREILYIVEPDLHGQAVAGRFEITEGQHGRTRRRGTPGFELHVRRATDRAEGIEALRNHVEDSRVVQVVPQRVVEDLKEISFFWVCRGSFEIRDRQADLLHAQTGAGADPVLGRGRCQKYKQWQQPLI